MNAATCASRPERPIPSSRDFGGLGGVRTWRPPLDLVEFARVSRHAAIMWCAWPAPDVTFVRLSEMKCHVAARRYGCLRPRFSHGGSRRIAAAGCKRARPHMASRSEPHPSLAQPSSGFRPRCDCG